ncbi:tripartite tricarboxylate transporter TctB family protein [Pseudoroseomonas globiformis]|uniref:Tripartite tricarboxylate transporter TctB family protein n=1 Tax=Teichococcus globiformis TaxID=2307229 RepID=A0ABV7G633_9PROT
MQLSDRVTGAALAILGAVTCFGASQQPGVPGQDVGPAVFPMIIGAGLIGCGAMIALRIGHSFEDPEAVVPVGPGEAMPEPPRFGEVRAFLPPLLLLFYVLVADTLGFLLTSALIMLVVARVLGASWRLALSVAVLASIGVATVFGNLLRVPLPGGLLPLPW